MEKEMNRVDEDQLDSVSGGKGSKVGKKKDISECPPGTIEIKNQQLQNTRGYVKKCPKCDSKNLGRNYFFMVDTSTLVEGQFCNSCDYKWIAKGDT